MQKGNENAARARNAEYNKRVNRLSILKILKRKPASRIELSSETGLTRAAITLITREMLSEGLIAEGETAPRAKKGKTPIPLSVNPEAFYAVGVYWTRTGAEIGLSDFSGNILSRKTVSLPVAGDLQPLADGIRALLRMHADKSIIGIGVSAPGPLDAENGVILHPPYFDKWRNTPVTKTLTDALSLPVYLEKDAYALAKYHLETGGSRDFLLLLVDSGVGSGVVTGGKLLISANQYTSELGHISIRFDGKKCACGNRGCLEKYASIPNLLEESGGRYKSWNEIIDNGDDQLIEREAEYLSAGIITIKNLVNIDTVYLAGHIKYGFELLSEKMQKIIRERSMLKSPVSILPSFSASEFGVSAAANLVFSKLLENL